jgi:DNA repair exonuclease SbcCD ATPase subunit
MPVIFLDKEKIRTMLRDIKEAEGVQIYPEGNEIEEVTQSFIAEKREEPIPSEPSFAEPETAEVLPEQGPLSVEEETKKAEDLAYELALSTNKSEDNVKQVLNDEAPSEKTGEEPPVTFMNLPEPEPEIAPEPEPEIEKPVVEEQIPESLPVEEPTPVEKELELDLPEKMPSAKELGLEEAERIPSAEELGLEEAKQKEEEITVIDENEEKLDRIAEQTLELEEALKDVNEEKAPFDQRKKEIEEEIENIKKKLELILEKKLRADEIKKDLEQKEALAQTPEEKRAVEKERWRVEDERNSIEKEKYEKEDEIKSLRLQVRECDLNAEKVMAKEKDTLQQLEILKRDKNRIVLGQAKKDLEERLKPLNQAIEDIKKEMFENTKQRDKSDKGLADIAQKEKAVEDEIKILERRQGETTDEVILRDIELRRRTAEEQRRALEKDRWEIEDKVRDFEGTRKIIKEKYQEVSAQIRQIKDELISIDQKIK